MLATPDLIAPLIRCEPECEVVYAASLLPARLASVQEMQFAKLLPGLL